jgi:tRNA U34 2-thiouridine synthase MnmA/TrmU
MEKLKRKAKALCLVSGGLDSRLALLLVKEQAEVEAIFFNLPFGSGCCKESCAFNFTQMQSIKLHVVDCTKKELFRKYINIIRNPKYGYGSGINPCIDCHIFMLKQSKETAKKINADFIVTGEVLNERPFSQHRKALKLIEEESSFKGRILKPLSAKLLPETIVEKQGLIARDKLLDISGRSRKKQLELAKRYKINFPSPGGGCLLCEKEFAIKLKDLFRHKKRISECDIELLKIGRHFRIGKTKIIVGRNHEENLNLKRLASSHDIVMEAKDVPSPITLIKGAANKEIIRKAAELTARYSDAKNNQAVVKYAKKIDFDKSYSEISVSEIKEQEIEKLRIK